MTTRDWIVPGAKVAIYSCRFVTPTIAVATVERLTATQIVLANDSRRFRRDTLRQVGDNYGGELKPLTDPQVCNVLARQELRDLHNHIDRLVAVGVGRDVDNVLATLDQITAAVDATRTAITTPQEA